MKTMNRILIGLLLGGLIATAFYGCGDARTEYTEAQYEKDRLGYNGPEGIERAAKHRDHYETRLSQGARAARAKNEAAREKQVEVLKSAYYHYKGTGEGYKLDRQARKIHPKLTGQDLNRLMRLRHDADSFNRELEALKHELDWR